MALTQITEKGIKDGEIINADINASAAIAKSKLASLDIVNADVNASAAIAKSKLASLDIVNADINASAAIAGTKVAPDFGNQNIATTGTITASGTIHSTLLSASQTSTGGILKLARTGTANGEYQFRMSNDSGTDCNLRIYDVKASATRFTISSDGEIGIGTTSPTRQLTINDNSANTFIRIQSSDTGNAGLEFGDQSDTVQGAIYQNSTSNSLIFNGYNNATRMVIDDYGVIRVGNTHDQGTSGNTKRIALGAKASIWGWTTGNINGALTLADNYYWTGTQNIAIENDHSAYLSLRSGNLRYGTTNSTHAAGAHISGGIHERFRIETNGNATINNGNLVIETSGHGIDFSATSDATGNSSELLDDYEEGTWTPTFPNNGTGNQALGTTLAEYVKIGRFVYAFMYANITGAPQSNGTTWVIGGLPYVANVSTLTHHGTGNVTYVGSSSYQQWRPLVTNYGQVYFHRTDGSNNVLKNSDVASEGMGYWIMGVNYMTS